MHVRRGDLVEVRKGADAWDPDKRLGRGRVLKVFRDTNRVIVEGMRMVVKNQGKTQENPQGARIRKEAALEVSNVLVVCPKCDRGVRVGQKIDANGRKVRYCKRCQETILTPEA